MAAADPPEGGVAERRRTHADLRIARKAVAVTRHAEHAGIHFGLSPLGMEQRHGIGPGRHVVEGTGRLLVGDRRDDALEPLVVLCKGRGGVVQTAAHVAIVVAQAAHRHRDGVALLGLGDGAGQAHRKNERESEFTEMH